MTCTDDQGPMNAPRTTRDVMKAAPAAPEPPRDEPDGSPTDAATQTVHTGQEDA